MTAVTSDSFFEWIMNTISGATPFHAGTSYIITLAMVLITCLIISPKKISNMKVLALPVMIGFTIVGFSVPLLYLGIASIIFVMETLSLQAIGGLVSGAVQRITEATEIPEIRRTKKYMKEIRPLERRSNINKAILTDASLKRTMVKTGFKGDKQIKGKIDNILKKQLKGTDTRIIPNKVIKDTFITIDEAKTKALERKIRNKKDRKIMKQFEDLKRRIEEEKEVLFEPKE